MSSIKARRISSQERAAIFGRASGKRPDPSACDRRPTGRSSIVFQYTWPILLADDFSLREPSQTSSGGTLQDLAGVQVPLLAGVVSLLIGDALQDRFATFTRELVDRGNRVLAAERS